MPKKQNKDIATIVADKLGLVLNEYAEHVDDELIVYNTNDDAKELSIDTSKSVVTVITRGAPVERRDYNIDVVLTEVDDIDRPPYQQRVIDEERDLSARLDKLTRFIETETFNNLPPVEREDLVTQQKHMGYYREVLRSRISRFNA